MNLFSLAKIYISIEHAQFNESELKEHGHPHLEYCTILLNRML